MSSTLTIDIRLLGCCCDYSTKLLLCSSLKALMLSDIVDKPRSNFVCLISVIVFC